MRPIVCVLVLLAAACSEPAPDPTKDDTPTSGKVTILADEDLRFLLEDHELVFNATYEKAAVTVRYLPEAQLLKAMLADSVRAVFGSFVPGGEQEAYFRTRNMTVHAERIAMDAIAVIAAETNPIKKLSLDELKAMLTSAVSGTKVLFESGESGVPRGIIDSLFAGDASRLKDAAALHSAEELRAVVSADPQTIGLIAFSRISDEDDERCRALRQGIKLVPVSRTSQSEAFPPDQGTLKDRSYPLLRPVLMTVVEGKSGLGTGFASFVAGPSGQRIILKQGLAPERVPSREIEIVQP